MKQHHSPQNRLISLLLCAALLFGLLPPLVMQASAESYNGVIANADKDYGPLSIVPSSLESNEAFMNAYVTNGGPLSLNGKFKLDSSQNYNGSSDKLPAGTIEGKKAKMWYASYRLDLTDRELNFVNDILNSIGSLYFETKLIPDYHSHGWISKRWEWSVPAFSISGPDADGSNSWKYKTNGRNGDPGYDLIKSKAAMEKNDGQPQSVSGYWSTLPRDGNIFFNAYQLWNRDCGDSEVQGTVFYIAAGGGPRVEDVYLKYKDGDSVKKLSSLSDEVTEMQVVLEMDDAFRFADNREHDLSNVKIYLEAEYLEQSDYTGSFNIAATFDHMTEDSLVFNFTVKKSWKHFRITAVSGENCGLNKETELVVWDCNGKTLDAVKLTSETYFSDFYGSPMKPFNGRSFLRDGYYTFDCTNPELSRVELTKVDGSEVPLYNQEVTGAWDENIGNKSDVYVGVGDELTFKLYFSENITLENQKNARAVLSITQGTSPIKLSVKSVAGKCVTFHPVRIETGMLDPGELVYIEKLESFKVLDQIKNSLTITDMTKKPAQQAIVDVGKPYTDTTATLEGGSDVYDAYADSGSAYRFSFPVKFHDEAAPNNGNTGVSGTGVKFMLEMADGTVGLPYRWYMDTRQEIRSDAVWQPGTTGGENTQLDISENQIYWVHVELDKAADYHYTLDEEGIWFNGKLTFHYLMDWAGNKAETVSYPLCLQMDREDPAVSFASKLSMTTEFLENNDVKLDFALKFTGRDNFALKYFYYRWEETNANGEFVPIDDSFTRIDVSNGFNPEETRQITHQKTVGPNDRGKVRVQVYVEDHLGRVSDTITCDPVSWIFGGIKNHSTVTENDIFSPTRKVTMDMNAPTTEGDTANTPTAMLVIPDVDSRNEDGEYTEFWIWATKSNYDNYNPLDQYTEWYENDFYWYDRVLGALTKVKGTIDVENAEGIFTEVLQINEQPEDLAEEMKETVSAAQKEFYEYLTTYYGSMELYTVSTYSVDDDFTSMNFKSAESAINTYTVYLADEITYDVEWTVVNAQGQTDAEAEAAGGVKMDYSGGYPATSLDNASVTLKITNTSDPRGRNGVKYGLDHVDFSEGNAAFELYYTGSSHYNQNNSYDDITRYEDRPPIRIWDLVESADGSNTVVLEPGLCTENGFYVMTFRYTNTYTGKTEKMILGGFYKDDTTLDISVGHFHKAAEWNSDEDDNIEEDFVWYLDDIEERYRSKEVDGELVGGEEIRVGLAPLPEGWQYAEVYNFQDGDWYETELTFVAGKRPGDDPANYVTDDLAAVRVYNATYNELAGLDRDASAGWIASSDNPVSYSTVTHSFMPYVAEPDAGEPYGVVDEKNMLPFVDGTNLIVYEIRASNGIITSHEMVIYVETKEPEWDIDYSISTNETTGMPTGITVWPTDTEGFPLDCNGSQAGDDNEYYDQTRYNFREVSNYDEDYEPEYQYDESVQDKSYLLIDPYGNVSIKTLTVYDTDGETVLFVDSDEPDFSQFHLCSDPDCETEHVKDQMYNLTSEFGEDSYHVMLSTQDWLDWDGTHYGSPIDPDSLVIYFDEEYSQLLDGDKDEQGRVYMSLPLARDGDGNLLMNEDGTYAVWEDLDNPVNGIYRTQIKTLTEAEVTVAIWGVWKACDDPELNLSGNRTIWITSSDVYGNEQWSTSYYSDSFNPSVVAGGYSFGVGSIAHDVGFVDDWSGESYTTKDTIAENVPDSEGVLGIYSTVPFQNISGWGVDVDDVVEVVVTMDGNHLGYDEYGTEYVPAGRYYFYPAPMITEDGTYYFSVTDLFGVSYDQEPGTVTEEQSAMFHEKIPVEVNVFGEMGIHVEFSTTNPTNKSVTVYATSTGNYENLKSITAENGTVGVIDPSYPKNGYITVDGNTVITITAENEWGEVTTRKVKVTNIDKELEEASILYFDQSYDPLNTEIGATEVTAVLVCDELVTATNGPDTYTFPSGSTAGTTYTFEYRDEAGNTGSITATLPVDLREPEVPEEYVDTSMPELEASLYAYKEGGYDLIERARNPEAVDGESELTAPVSAMDGFRTQKYRLVLNVRDEGEVKILITEPGAAAPTDFASVRSGCAVEHITMTTANYAASLEITENVVFDIHLIDSNNNVATFPLVKLGNIDRTAPVLTPVYEPGISEDGIATVIATFEPGEADKFEEIIPLTPDVVSKMVEVDGKFVLRYYHVFQENGTYSFTYRDAIGNTGTAVAQVSGLSNEATVVRSISWFGTAPAGHANLAPDRSTPVNRDITAQLDMSKAIRDVELFVYSAGAEGQMGAPVSADAPVSVSFTGNTINITYSENVDYRIVVRFTASETGRKGTYILPAVTCIDKTVPVVTLKGTALSADKRSMTFTFETTKPTVLDQNAADAATLGFRTTHTWTATCTDPMKLTFVDQTGNQAVYEITEFPGLDTLRLVTSYSPRADGSDATDDPANDLNLFGGSVFYICANKNATASINGGESFELAAGVWTKVTTPIAPGFHILKLTDSYTGESMTELIRAMPKDNLAPVIELASSTVLVWQNASLESMMAAIRDGVVIRDNVDTDLDFTVTGYPDSTAETGLFTLRYTARDHSGNSISTERNLYIMAENAPILRINGEIGLPFGKVYLNTREITLAMENMEHMQEQPLVVKLRKGLQTTGQMKYYAETVENMAFEVTETGHYTIYVRAQDRTEFVTYIYVEG